MKAAFSPSDTARDFATSIVTGTDNGIYYAIGAHETMKSDPSTSEYADGLLADYLDMKATVGFDSAIEESQTELASYAVDLDNAIVAHAGLDDMQRSRLIEDRELGDTLPIQRLVNRFYFG